MGTLYVVATPIGNLEDVTLRALRVLRETDLLLAEDTRRTRVLLERHHIRARPLSLHAHNEAERVHSVLVALAAGGSVALVSDAGTPLVSDPGERLVREVRAAGHAVVAIPGASAPLAALVSSGLATTPFTFLGFPPRRAGERRRLFESLRERRETLIFFESPRRLVRTLGELAEVLGDRRACVGRELTKRHEEVVPATLCQLARHFAEGVRGEVTLVVEGSGGPELLAGEALRAEIRTRLATGEGPRQVAAALAGRTDLSRSELYALALSEREAAETPRAQPEPGA